MPACLACRLASHYAEILEEHYCLVCYYFIIATPFRRHTLCHCLFTLLYAREHASTMPHTDIPPHTPAAPARDSAAAFIGDAQPAQAIWS